MKKILLFLIIIPGFLFADVPVRSEQLIYSIMAFNGRDYSGTFSREDADKIYLIADVDDFLSVGKTMVYYWPITAEWKTDTDSLDISFTGTLEVTGKDIEPVIIEQTRYTYYNVSGEYEFNWIVAKGDEADKAWQDYQDTVDEYYQKVQRFQQEKALYDVLIDQLVKEITKRRDAGEDVSRLIEAMKKAEPPKEPSFPTDYNAPPARIREAFIVNLPVGEYNIRFVNQDGTVMEGSESGIVVFEKRRTGGIGLEVIPGDKWTRPITSKTPSSVLYIDGSTDIYLRPFFQQEYNDLYYEKMLRNDARGNPNLIKWVRIQQVPKAGILIEGPGIKPAVVNEQSFVVEQIKGAALGYQIVEYDPVGPHKYKQPSLIAFHIPLDSDTTALNITVLDKDGLVLQGSRRQVRVIDSPGPGVVLIILALAPLLVIGIIRINRNRKYTK